MADTKVSDVVARPVRTATQAAPAWIITEFIDAWIYDMDERQFGVLVLLLTMLIGGAQVAIENHFGKAFLRNIPEPDAPVVGDDDPPVAGPGDEPAGRHEA